MRLEKGFPTGDWYTILISYASKNYKAAKMIVRVPNKAKNFKTIFTSNFIFV